MSTERYFTSTADFAVAPYSYPTLRLCNERGRCAALTIPVTDTRALLWAASLFGLGYLAGRWLK